MKRMLWLTGLAVVLLSSIGWGQTPMDAALSLIPDNGDVAIRYDDAGRAALEQAISTLETALGVTAAFDATDEAFYMALDIPAERKPWVNKLAQAYYTLGDVFLHGLDGAKTAFIKGQLWGLKSLRMSVGFLTEETRHGFVEAVQTETDVAALYWTYGNWARKDEFDVLGAVFRDDPPKLLALIERAFELDSSYLAYGAYRSLAAFWGGLPPLPLIAFGQNLPRALSYICPVVKEPQLCSACDHCPVAPDVEAYFENRLIFAEYYLMEKGLWSDAARVLQSILDDPIGDLHPLYNAFCQTRAEELMADVRDHL